jgi:chromosome segregation ATPase
MFKAKIKARSYTWGFAAAEKIYQTKLKNLAADHLKNLENQKNEAEREKNEAVKNREDELSIEINNLKMKILDLKEQIKSNQKAWLKYKDYIPELFNIAQIIKTIKYTKHQRSAESYKTSEQAADKIEYLSKRLSNLEPEINKLLGIK